MPDAEEHPADHEEGDRAGGPVRAQAGPQSARRVGDAEERHLEHELVDDRPGEDAPRRDKGEKGKPAGEERHARPEVEDQRDRRGHAQPFDDDDRGLARAKPEEGGGAAQHLQPPGMGALKGRKEVPQGNDSRRPHDRLARPDDPREDQDEHRADRAQDDPSGPKVGCVAGNPGKFAGLRP